MGFFDKLKSKASGNASKNTEQSKALIGELKAQYGLIQKPTPAGSALSGLWWQGTVDTGGGSTQVAFMASATGLATFIGTPQEISDIYLIRARSAKELPSHNHKSNLHHILGAEGMTISNTWYLGAHPDGAFDYPELRLEPVSKALRELSEGVSEIMIFPSGIKMLMDVEKATDSTINSDLQHAQVIMNSVMQ